MRAEVVAIGTELLLGQIVDTNSSWMGEQLALAGIDSLHQTKVGDNADRIRGAIELALSRSDAVICCGGLGPTQDDITRDVIADLMGVELVLDEEIADRIRSMFERRGRTMPANNLSQAMVPVGASTMAQQPGTAPGLVAPIGSQVIYAVPGVPREMREMVLGTVIPDLRRRSGETAVIRSRVLRTWGESESGLAELLADRIDELDADRSRTLAFLASGIEGIKVRVTAKAADEAAALAVLDEEEQHLRSLLGELVFGLDDETMEHAVLDLLRSRGLTLAVAESLTGGLLATRLTDVPGASDVFRGGIVSYATDVKHELLDVPAGPVVSAAAAEAMAVGARTRLGADVGLSTTGVAGPTEQEGQPVGTVHLGIAIGDEVFSRQLHLPGDRTQIRQFSVISVLDLFRRHLVA
ncbi:MAG: competence/damage-inducible protein A [Actinomycetota bacterium]